MYVCMYVCMYVYIHMYIYIYIYIGWASNDFNNLRFGTSIESTSGT